MGGGVEHYSLGLSLPEDIDECLVNNGGCAERCINVPGSYACIDGFRVLVADNRTCIPKGMCCLYVCVIDWLFVHFETVTHHYSPPLTTTHYHSLPLMCTSTHYH